MIGRSVRLVRREWGSQSHRKVHLVLCSLVCSCLIAPLWRHPLVCGSRSSRALDALAIRLTGTLTRRRPRKGWSSAPFHRLPDFRVQSSFLFFVFRVCLPPVRVFRRRTLVLFPVVSGCLSCWVTGLSPTTKWQALSRGRGLPNRIGFV